MTIPERSRSVQAAPALQRVDQNGVENAVYEGIVYGVPPHLNPHRTYRAPRSRQIKTTQVQARTTSRWSPEQEIGSQDAQRSILLASETLIADV
jgi:hypothetical protein